jgi:hypothetical protein
MTRSTAEIKLEITNDYISKPEVIAQYGLVPGLTFEEQFSEVSVENIMFDTLAFQISTHEKIVSKNAENSRPQNLPNTIEWLLNFHDGLPLVWNDGEFKYDLTNVVDADVRKIISQCAILESNDGTLVIKVARKVGASLEPLLADQLGRLQAYAKDKKVPGVELQFINKEADQLKAKLKVFVDPQMIDLTTGRQLNVSETIYPVKDAINEYLTKLEFNGAFVTNFFTRAIEDKDGINLVNVEAIQWKFDALDFADLKNYQVPESGHYKLLDANLEIIYEPYVLVNH